MAKQHNLPHHQPLPPFLKAALMGAGLAFLLVSFFVLLLGSGDSSYGAWVFLPMATVSLGGAMGGVLLSYLMGLLQNQRVWQTRIGLFAGSLLYLVLLWLSLVAALSVTGHWD
ncbi:hypothetical protein FOE74_10030 [Rufibacter glacialis]|uniref:Potassium transporter KefB n=1 Tax=Rufibacter glacialis TaxID=1259555 RepID=A0A5M8QI97_9BACT|nr:hypothetical protein FOE74_10030 [Rufibacter glacialis]